MEKYIFFIYFKKASTVNILWYISVIYYEVKHSSKTIFNIVQQYLIAYCSNLQKDTHYLSISAAVVTTMVVPMKCGSTHSFFRCPSTCHRVVADSSRLRRHAANAPGCHATDRPGRPSAGWRPEATERLEGVGLPLSLVLDWSASRNWLVCLRLVPLHRCDQTEHLPQRWSAALAYLGVAPLLPYAF